MRKGTIELVDGIISENQVTAKIQVDDDGEFIVNLGGEEVGHGAISGDMVEWDAEETSFNHQEVEKIERWLIAGDEDAVPKKKHEPPIPTYAQLQKENAILKKIIASFEASDCEQFCKGVNAQLALREGE